MRLVAAILATFVRTKMGALHSLLSMFGDLLYSYECSTEIRMSTCTIRQSVASTARTVNCQGTLKAIWIVHALIYKYEDQELGYLSLLLANIMKHALILVRVCSVAAYRL